jgi:hypothetical protein
MPVQTRKGIPDLHYGFDKDRAALGSRLDPDWKPRGGARMSC